MNTTFEEYYLIEATEDGYNWEPYTNSYRGLELRYETAERALQQMKIIVSSASKFFKEFRVMKYKIIKESQCYGSIEMEQN